MEAKPKFHFREILWILRAIDARQIEHEVSVRAVCVKLLWSAAKVILVNVIYFDVRTGAVPVVTDVLQVFDQVETAEPVIRMFIDFCLSNHNTR